MPTPLPVPRRIARGLALIMIGWLGPGLLLFFSGARIPNGYWYGFIVLNGLQFALGAVEMFVRFQAKQQE